MTHLAATVASALALACCVAVPALAHADEVVSLESLIEAGQQHHPTLAKQPLLIRSLSLQESSIGRAYWPQLSLNGVATWQSDVTSVDIAVPGVSISPPPKDQYRATLELQQTIWDGGVTGDQKRVARERARVEHEKVNLEWYQVRERILQLYFVGIVQQELRDQAESLERHLTTVVDTARVALDNGVTTEREVLLAQARRLEAQEAMAEASAQLASVKQSLAELTGEAMPASAALAVPAKNCAASGGGHPAPSTVRRPELDILAAQGQLLDAQQALERASDLPRLGAFATAGYGRPGLNMLSDEFDFYFIGGVRLTVPLTYIYAGTWSNNREQLAVQRSLLARQRDAVMTQVNVALDTQRAELSRLDGALERDDELLGVRERTRKQTELELSLGTATMTDLVGDLTQEDLVRSKRTLHRAQRNLACHQIDFIKGEL